MLVGVGKRFVSEQSHTDKQFGADMKEFLCKSPVFKDCHHEFVRDLIVSSTRKEYAPNRYLMEEGSRGDSMYVIIRGLVEVTAGGRYICKLRSGSMVGETALLSLDNRRTATVRSVQKCDVAIIFRNAFHSILEKYPWEKKKFQREMKAKLMELGNVIDAKEDLHLEQQAIQCDALKKVPFFGNDDSMHEFVAELALNGVSVWYRPGRVIIQEGDTQCDEMYVILKGAVEITACGEFLGRLENDMFGEICMLDLLERRTASVVASTQCACISFSRQVLIPILAKYPDVRLKLLEHSRNRLIQLGEVVGSDMSREMVNLARPAARLPGCAVGFGTAVQSADAHLFSASPIFCDARLDLLQDLSMQLETKRMDAGKVIIEEGSVDRRDDLVYFLAKGQVEVWKAGTFVTVLQEGAVFGELAVFHQKKSGRHATVKSRTQVVLRTIRATPLQESLRKHEDPDLMMRWEEDMGKRMQQLQHKVHLKHEMSTNPVHIDIMFMKGHTRRYQDSRDIEGWLVPKADSVGDVQHSLEHTMKLHSARGRLPISGKQAPLPLTAR